MNVYLDVTYTILLVDSVLDLKVGDVVNNESLHNSCFITAFNPNGNEVDIQTNWEFNNNLMDYILNNNFKYYHGYGHLNEWVEYSFLIKDISIIESLRLSREFKQLAFVYININGVVELHYT
tara:strand:- start:1579 stop:1944 length:366 start_codon:yes stop_codon:yes gene_type:complete